MIANSPGALAAAATLTVTQATAGTFAGTIVQIQSEYSSSGTVGALSLVTQGSATLTLSGSNSYTGSTTVSAGTLSVGADANLGNDGNVILNGGTLLANTTFTLNSSGIFVGPASGPGSGEIDVAAGQTLTYGGTISDGGTGNLIVGSGGATGTLLLSGFDTNSATSVAAGTLQVTGTLVGSVTVNGGTLGGAGTVGAVTDNATINPGLGATSILNTGNLSFGPGAVYSVTVSGAASAGSNYDQLNVTGSIDLTGAILQLNVSYSPTVGDSYTIIHNVNGTAITGTFTGLNEGSYLVAGGHLFQITYQGNGNERCRRHGRARPVYYLEADGWVGRTQRWRLDWHRRPNGPGRRPGGQRHQSALFGGNTAVMGSGYKAFTSVNAALAQIADDGAVGASLIDNGGVFNQDVVISQPIALDTAICQQHLQLARRHRNQCQHPTRQCQPDHRRDNANTQVSSGIQGTAT